MDTLVLDRVQGYSDETDGKTSNTPVTKASSKRKASNPPHLEVTDGPAHGVTKSGRKTTCTSEVQHFSLLAASLCLRALFARY
jgi:hypothetical protein